MNRMSLNKGESGLGSDWGVEGEEISHGMEKEEAGPEGRGTVAAAQRRPKKAKVALPLRRESAMKLRAPQLRVEKLACWLTPREPLTE